MEQHITYRMTKKDARNLAGVLKAMGIRSKVELTEGTKSTWTISFSFDQDAYHKQEQKQAPQKKCPVGEALRAQVRRHGIPKICEKYGISERTVYRRMKIEP